MLVSLGGKMDLNSSKQPVDTQSVDRMFAKRGFQGFRFKIIISLCVIVLLIIGNFTIYFVIGTRYNPRWEIETADSNREAWDVGNPIGLTPDGNPVIKYESQEGIQIAIGKENHNWQHDDIGNSENSYYSSSMVVDAHGTIHLLYVSGSSLIYTAKNKGTWEQQIVILLRDPRSSLAVDSNGNPNIVYYEYNYLNYTHRTNGNWSKNTIDNLEINRSIKIKLDSLAHPHILTPGTSESEFNYYYWNGSNWTKEIIDCHTYFVQYRSDLGIDNNGSPHIVFVDEVDSTLKYITKIGTEWKIETIDKDSISHTPAMNIDKNNVVHLAYYSDNSGLKYAKKIKNHWFIEIIDSSKKAGSSPSIITDKTGNIHIAYVDRNVWHLNYATTKATRFFMKYPITQIDYLPFFIVSIIILVISPSGISRLISWYQKRTKDKKELVEKPITPSQK
jgi:hypothetical protein